MTEPISAYANAVDAAARLRRERDEATMRANRELQVIDAKIAAAERTIAFAELGGNADDQAIADKVLRIEWARDPGAGQQWADSPRTGPVRVTAEVLQQIDRAITLMRAGDYYLQHSYLGVKSYDGFASQVADTRKGYGPRHGHIWFRIEYAPAYSSQDTNPSEAERIACIRYLTAIRNNPALMGGVK